jgi:hypothetical protein
MNPYSLNISTSSSRAAAMAGLRRARLAGLAPSSAASSRAASSETYASKAASLPGSLWHASRKRLSSVPRGSSCMRSMLLLRAAGEAKR